MVATTGFKKCDQIKEVGVKRMEVRYFVNPNTGTLHKVGCCYYSQTVPKESKKYRTEDDAISNEQKYMKHCKLCFRGK